ncbi:MAG: carboxyl transferase domain-containing protein [Achromobacter pulmonis]
MREVIARIVDGSEFDEFKARFGPTLVYRLRPHPRHAGRHHRQQRHPVHANRRRRARTSSSCAAQRKIPLVFLQNITGFMVGRKYENDGIARHGAKMVTAVATANVPKFTVHHRRLASAPATTACAAAPIRPRFLWMWPNARISVMGGEQAASVLATVKRDGIEAQAAASWTADEEDAFKAPIREQYERAGPSLLRHRAAVGRRHHRRRPTRAACWGWRCRRRCNAPIDDTRFGVFRM